METYDNLKKSVMLSFIHLSVQEYLAAFHIACLQQKDELKVLETLLYKQSPVTQDINHLNLVKMYIGLTKGQRPAFKQLFERCEIQHYLSHNFFICFFLFRTFYEADDKCFCRKIIKCFDDHRIIHNFDLPGSIAIVPQAYATVYRKRYHAHTALLPDVVENLTHFLAHQSPGELWQELHLDTSYIGDHGCQILHSGLIS